MSRWGERAVPGLRRRRPILLLLLPALSLALAGVGRFIGSSFRTTDEDAAATDAARTLLGQSLDQHQRRLEYANHKEAYASAQQFVRASLLPPGAAATFPVGPPPGPVDASRGDGIQSIQVTRLHPHRYRIRATVQWRDAQGRLQHRRFETDLQHGPADDRWYLVDTEFLDASH